MLQLLTIAARSLLEHRRRTLLLGVAIAIVTTLLVLLNGLSGGIRYTMLRAATTLSSGHVNVGGFFKLTSASPIPVVTDYEKVRDIVVKAVPELDYIIDRTRGWAKIVSEGGSLQAGLSGVDIEQERGLRAILRLAEEREYKDDGAAEVRGDIEALREPGTALIFVAQAKRLGVGVGDRLTLSAPTVRGVNNTADVRVVAVAKDIGFMSAWSVFLPNETLRKIYQLNDRTTGVLQLYLKDIGQIPEVMEKLRSALIDAGYEVMDHVGQPFFMKFADVKRQDWTGQKLDVTSWEDEVSFMSWTITTVESLTFLLVTILMILIMVGIMNTLFMAIRERTREIGTLRAIGMGRGRVLLMFLMEAGLLGLIASGVGVALGSVICAIVNAVGVAVPSEAFQVFTMSEVLWLRVDPAALLSAVLFISTLTTLAALYPAYRATRLKPVTAIHQVG